MRSLKTAPFTSFDNSTGRWDIHFPETGVLLDQEYVLSAPVIARIVDGEDVPIHPTLGIPESATPRT